MQAGQGTSKSQPVHDLPQCMLHQAASNRQEKQRPSATHLPHRRLHVIFVAHPAAEPGPHHILQSAQQQLAMSQICCLCAMEASRSAHPPSQVVAAAKQPASVALLRCAAPPPIKREGFTHLQAQAEVVQVQVCLAARFLRYSSLASW